MKLQIECESLIQQKKCPQEICAEIIYDILKFISTYDPTCGFNVSEKYDRGCRFIELLGAAEPVTFDRVAILLLRHAGIGLEAKKASRKGKPTYIVESVSIASIDEFRSFLDKSILDLFNKELEQARSGQPSYRIGILADSDLAKLTTDALNGLLRDCEAKLAVEAPESSFHTTLQQFLSIIRPSLATRELGPRTKEYYSLPPLPFTLTRSEVSFVSLVDPVHLVRQTFLTFLAPSVRKNRNKLEAEAAIKEGSKKPIEVFMQGDGIGDSNILRRVYKFLLS